MKWLVYGVLAAGLLSVSGCELFRPKPPPKTPTVTAAKKQPSAREPFREARDFSSEADRKAAEARARLSDARADLEVHRGRVLTLSEMVKKLQAEGSAAATDLKKLYDELQFQDAYIERLVDKLGAVQDDLATEKELRKKADEKLQLVSERLVAKEQEADTLRQQMSDQDKTIAELEKSAEENFAAAQKAAARADQEIGKRKLLTKILIGVSILAAISLLVNYLQFRGRLPF